MTLVRLALKRVGSRGGSTYARLKYKEVTTKAHQMNNVNIKPFDM